MCALLSRRLCVRSSPGEVWQTSGAMERVVRVKRGRNEAASEQLLIHTAAARPSKHARLADSLSTALDSLSVRQADSCLRPPDAAVPATAADVEDAIPTASTGGAPCHKMRSLAAAVALEGPWGPC
jgi:hypothetical protein